MGMELQGSREQNLGQQGKPGAKEELRDARQQRGRKRHGGGGREQRMGIWGQEPVQQQAQLYGTRAWSTVSWRET